MPRASLKHKAGRRGGNGAAPPKEPDSPHVAAALRYAKAVISGELPNCEWVIKACRRFLNDLERAKGDWPYTFDNAKAERPCRFIELLPHVKGKWAVQSPTHNRELLRLEDWQCFIVCNLFGWVRKDNRLRRFRIFYGEMPRKQGKAEWVANTIPTPAGYARMGDLQVGDFVFGSDGRPVQIIATTDEMSGRDCRVVGFSTGEQIIVAADHLWKVNRRIESVSRCCQWTVAEDETLRLAYGAGGANAAVVALPHRSRFALNKRAQVRGVSTGGRHRREQHKLDCPRVMSQSTAEDVIDTALLSETLFYGARGALRYSVDIPPAIILPDRDLPVPPYAFGVWLGDGDSDRPYVTGHFDDLEEIVAAIVADGVDVSIKSAGADRPHIQRVALGRHPDVAQRVKPNRVRAALVELGVLNNKHIPTCYLRASYTQRLALLRGLMDTDGAISVAGQCSFANTTKRLADNVRELVFSLGIKATLATKIAKIDGREIGECYTVHFYPPTGLEVFNLSRKAARQHPKKDAARSTTNAIVSVERCDSVPVRCITVNAPDGIYLTSRSFIPTHNSPLAAAIGLYMLAADGEAGAEVYAGATTEKQAWEVFRPAILMAEKTPALCSKFGIQVNASNIHILSTASRFEPLIGKPGDGAGPSCSITDEYHEHQTSEQFDTMITGMAAREQPLAFVITTAGDNISGPCYEIRDTIKSILNGVAENEEMFGLIYTVDESDDWSDPSVLRKANPNYDVSVSGEFLLARQHEALTSMRSRARFLTKHLGIWINSAAGFFDMAAWAACEDASLELECFKACKAQIGLDLASKKDIAALQILIEPDPIEKPQQYVVFGKNYLPQEAIEKPENEHYRDFMEHGFIIQTGGNVTDYGRIEEDILKLCDFLDVENVAYDPHQAAYLVTRLKHQNIPVIEYPAQVLNFSEPMKQLDAWIIAGKIKHPVDKCMDWMMGNVTAQMDRKDNVYPRKERNDKKIDGPVALISSVGLAMGKNAGGISVYDLLSDGEDAQSAVEPMQSGDELARPDDIDMAILGDPKHPQWQQMRERYEAKLAAADTGDFDA